jgi:hypothetical protein
MVWDTNAYLIDYKGDNFDEFLSNIRRIDIIRYSLSPIWVIFISSVICILIKAGLLVAEVEIKTSLLFKIVLVGFTILALPFWIKAVMLILVKGSYTPEDVKYFFPGSIIPFIDISKIDVRTINALSHVNIYHLGFMVFTAWQITKNSWLQFRNSFLLMIFTYGLGIVLLRCLILVFTM